MYELVIFSGVLQYYVGPTSNLPALLGGASLQEKQSPSNVCINRNHAGDTPVRWPCDDSKMSSWANFVESVPLFPPSCSSRSFLWCSNTVIIIKLSSSY